MIIAATRYGKVGGSRGLPTITTETGYIAPTAYTDQETGNWELVFLGNWRGQFGSNVDVDVFLVGGGQAGDPAGEAWEGTAPNYTDSFAYGGNGGNGGGTVTRSITLTKDTTYSVTIGESGTATTAFNITAESGDGATGGSGAKAKSGGSAGTDGGDGSYAFGDANTLYGAGVRYGAGGGGGGATSALGSEEPGEGGATGGGNGGVTTGNLGDGSPGAANTGAGGGGGRSTIYFGKAGGAGGSGICIIRNARTSS